MSPNGIRALDQQLRARSITHDLARIKIWNNDGLIVYSDNHKLIAQRPNEWIDTVLRRYQSESERGN